MPVIAIGVRQRRVAVPGRRPPTTQNHTRTRTHTHARGRRRMVTTDLATRQVSGSCRAKTEFDCLLAIVSA